MLHQKRNPPLELLDDLRFIAAVRGLVIKMIRDEKKNLFRIGGKALQA